MVITIETMKIIKVHNSPTLKTRNEASRKVLFLDIYGNFGCARGHGGWQANFVKYNPLQTLAGALLRIRRNSTHYIY